VDRFPAFSQNPRGEPGDRRSETAASDGNFRGINASTLKGMSGVREGLVYPHAAAFHNPQPPAKGSPI